LVKLQFRTKMSWLLKLQSITLELRNDKINMEADHIGFQFVVIKRG